MVRSFRQIVPPKMSTDDEKRLDLYLQWRDTFAMPTTWYELGHSRVIRFLPRNAREFREHLYEQYNGDITAFTKDMNVYAVNWAYVTPPPIDYGYSRRNQPKPDKFVRAYQAFKKTCPVADRIMADLDRCFARYYLMRRYKNIEQYNGRHGTSFGDFREVYLANRLPEQEPARGEWADFVRHDLNPNFVRLELGPELDRFYQGFLAEKYHDIQTLNLRYGTDYHDFLEITCPSSMPQDTLAGTDFSGFISDEQTLPLKMVEIYGPRQAFEVYVARQTGRAIDPRKPVLLPLYEADYYDAMANKSALRKEFTTRNYKQVLGYIWSHGRGIVNTFIYCSLMIVAALLVNPLAAYALSRYKPPSQYSILLFCMATMAFPTAVTMIPAFLLLKRFPLWSLVAGIVCFFGAMWALHRFAGQLSERIQVVLSAGLAILVGYWLAPALMGDSSVSLLNTFAALILPGMANGYFIFLLKGFFDSLPREIYEAADLDGAGEWTKFWVLTMESLQANSGGHCVAGVHYGVHTVHDGSYYYTGSEDVDADGVVVSIADRLAPSRHVRLVGNCRNPHVLGLCDLPECYHQRDCRSYGEVIVALMWSCQFGIGEWNRDRGSPSEIWYTGFFKRIGLLFFLKLCK